MRAAYVYATSHLFRREERPLEEAVAALERSLATSGRYATSLRAMALELVRQGLLESCEAWRFWDLPSAEVRCPGRLPTWSFQSDGQGASDDLARHVASGGPPDVLFIEGRRFPANLAQVLALCPSSFRVYYSQNWKPWKMDGLDHYDLCLADEERQVPQVRERVPDLHCEVWDKLIDYERGHYPIDCEKPYDVCYVAELRPRKEHEVMLQALARLRDRHLRAVCVGEDFRGRRAELAALAAELGVDVTFTGGVGKEEVNALVNRSRVGLVCPTRDAAPRIILEYMAADVPQVVNAKLRAGRHYLSDAAGVLRPAEQLHEGIAEVLDHPERFAPRAHFEAHYTRERVVPKFLDIMARAGCPLT